LAGYFWLSLSLETPNSGDWQRKTLLHLQKIAAGVRSAIKWLAVGFAIEIDDQK
jgi:hypothetical protein